jgi:hypothetical protein
MGPKKDFRQSFFKKSPFPAPRQPMSYTTCTAFFHFINQWITIKLFLKPFACREKETTNTLMTSNTQATITEFFVQRHFPWNPKKFQEVLPIKKKCSFSFSFPAAHFANFHFEVFFSTLTRRSDFVSCCQSSFSSCLSQYSRQNSKKLSFWSLFIAATTLILEVVSLDRPLSAF